MHRANSIDLAGFIRIYRNDVLLYEGSSVINSIPSKLHVTYGALVYRTMVPLFATTTVVPFEEIANVVLTSSYGIRVVSVELQPAVHSKRGNALTIATGLEVDLLYQLLTELLDMHKQEEAQSASLQTQEHDQLLLKTLLDYDEDEEHKVEA